MVPGAKEVLSAVSCVSRDDHKIVFEAFKPVCVSLVGGGRVVRRMRRTVGGERHPQGLRLCSNEPSETEETQFRIHIREFTQQHHTSSGPVSLLSPLKFCSLGRN